MFPSSLPITCPRSPGPQDENLWGLGEIRIEKASFLLTCMGRFGSHHVNPLKWFYMTRCEVIVNSVWIKRSKCQRHLFVQFKMHDMVKCRSEFSLVARFWTSKWCWWPELFTVLHIAQELETPVVRLRWCLCLSLLHLSARWQGAVCRECRGQH